MKFQKTHFLLGVLSMFSLICGSDKMVFAQDAKSEGEFQALLKRLDSAEKRIQELESSRPMLPANSSGSKANGKVRVIGSEEFANSESSNMLEFADSPKFYADYDGGFMIRPYDKEANPFELKINGRMQFRYQGFHRNIRTFNNLGGAVPVEHRNDFEIERGRLVFSGIFYDPKLHFFLNLDGDTDDNHRVVFHDFWINYAFSDAFDLHVGKAFVPGSREWLNGSTRTHLADRSLATTFFRPDRSLGVWATGHTSNGTFYRFMVGNGFNTSDLERTGFQIDNRLFFAGSMWWEPWGKYGKGAADLKGHESPVIRFGHSFAFGEQDPVNGGVTTEEKKDVRLTDGTRLTDAGVDEFDLYLQSIDFAIKYRGWSLNSEFYFRWLNDLQSNGAFSHSSLFQHGFTTDFGYMICPEKLELVGRISQVDGFFKDSWEYAGGLNWYLNGTHKQKVTFDVTKLDGSPASNSGPGFEIGMDGWFYRLQFQSAF